MDIDLSTLFDSDLGARPATFIVDATDADSDELEISVAFSRDLLVALDTQNATPNAWAQTTDVPGVSKKSGLIVHYGFLLAEDGSKILDEDGEDLIAENEFTYKVSGSHSDAFGVTLMELSLVTPKGS